MYSPQPSTVGGTISGNASFNAVNPITNSLADGGSTIILNGSYSPTGEHQGEIVLRAADVAGGGGMIMDMYQLADPVNHSAQMFVGDTSGSHFVQMWQINGNGTGRLLGFFGAGPIAQPAAIAAPSGGTTVDTQARAAIQSILNMLGAATGGYGLTA